MTDWLATTWEASWRPFQYFNLYRLILAAYETYLSGKIQDV